MESDPTSDPTADRQFMLNFAQTEFFEIGKERARYRQISMGITGFVVPISTSLLLNTTEKAHLAHYALFTILVGLSFAYMLLCLLFLHSSRSHHRIKKNLDSALEHYFSENKPEDRILFHRTYVWTFVNFMAFVFPAICCLVGAIIIMVTFSLSYCMFLILVAFSGHGCLRGLGLLSGASIAER